MAIALTAAGSLGKVAALICGDFKIELKLTLLENGLAWAGWDDLTAGLGHTCEASHINIECILATGPPEPCVPVPKWTATQG